MSPDVNPQFTDEELSTGIQDPSLATQRELNVLNRALLDNLSAKEVWERYMMPAMVAALQARNK